MSGDKLGEAPAPGDPGGNLYGWADSDDINIAVFTLKQSKLFNYRSDFKT